MAATVTKIIDPNSGAGFDYTSLSAWEAAMQKNLVTADEISVAKCRCTGGTSDTTKFTVDGWTTDATRYIKILTDPTETYRHSGKWTTGNKYILKGTTSGSSQIVLNNLENYTQIIGLQVELALGASTHDGCAAIETNSIWAGISTISHNVIRQTGTSGTYMDNWGIWLVFGDGHKVYNNIIYDFVSGSGGNKGGAIGMNDGGGVAFVYCNTIVNCGRGILDYEDGDLIRAKNNVFKTIRDYTFENTLEAASGRNVSDEATLAELCTGATADSGTTTSTLANHLVQTGQNFLTTCIVGMVVKNTTDTTYAYITAINSNTDLTISADIMVSGEAFTIYQNMYGSVTFENEGSDDFHLGTGDTAAQNKGYNLYADASIAVVDDIDGTARPSGATLFDIGADEIVAISIKIPISIILNSVNSTGSITND